MIRLIGASLFAALHSGAAFAEPPQVKSEGPVAFPASQQLVLHSEALNRDFMVRITPPMMPPPQGQKAAAVYMLDGNLYFGMATDTLRLMTLENEAWPTYVIAVGYDTTNPMVVINSRQNDYLHTRLTEPGTTRSYGGGGFDFEKFLIEDQKPFIEARLPVDPAKSVLAGHSFGGRFVASVIANRPDAFAGYSIGSPSIWGDASIARKLETLKGADRKVFVGVGENEVTPSIDMVKDAEGLAGALTRAGFSTTYKVYQGQGHGAVPNAWIADSFRFLLARPKS